MVYGRRQLVPGFPPLHHRRLADYVQYRTDEGSFDTTRIGSVQVQEHDRFDGEQAGIKRVKRQNEPDHPTTR
jgi:hypothetical protein